MEAASAAGRGEDESLEEEMAELGEADEERPRKQIYLRTVYPLNPGIPHYLDNPSGW